MGIYEDLLEKKVFDVFSVILMGLLLMRGILTTITGIAVFDVSSVMFGIAYLVAFVGIFTYRQWGSILAVIVSIVNIITTGIYQETLMDVYGGAGLLGAISVDLVIIFLAWREYGLRSKKHKEEK